MPMGIGLHAASGLHIPTHPGAWVMRSTSVSNRVCNTRHTCHAHCAHLVHTAEELQGKANFFGGLASVKRLHSVNHVPYRSLQSSFVKLHLHSELHAARVNAWPLHSFAAGTVIMNTRTSWKKLGTPSSSSLLILFLLLRPV
jgi:hypothetical protein